MSPSAIFACLIERGDTPLRSRRSHHARTSGGPTSRTLILAMGSDSMWCLKLAAYAAPRALGQSSASAPAIPREPLAPVGSDRLGGQRASLHLARESALELAGEVERGEKLLVAAPASFPAHDVGAPA